MLKLKKARQYESEGPGLWSQRLCLTKLSDLGWVTQSVRLGCLSLEQREVARQERKGLCCLPVLSLPPLPASCFPLTLSFCLSHPVPASVCHGHSPLGRAVMRLLKELSKLSTACGVLRNLQCSSVGRGFTAVSRININQTSKKSES